MNSNRVRIGFHRLGIALALLPGLAAVGVLATGVYVWGRPLVKPPKWQIEHKETRRSFEFTYGTDPKMIGRKMKDLFSPMSVPESVVAEVDEIIAGVDTERRNGLELLTIGAALSALAIGLYAASWLLGWIVRGFLGEGVS